MKLKIAIIVAAFITLCTVSVSLSSRYFSSGMSTQTAHVLTSLRSLHDWGFFTLRGVSVLIPRSRELEGLDFGRFTMEFNEAIYLSYPSGWLDLPYGAFVVVHAVAPSVQIGEAFLLSYNVIIDRLVTAMLLGFFFPAFLAVLMEKRLSSIRYALIGLVGCAFWLLSPPVLYWTQNAYGMDEGVIPFVVALLLFVARKHCRISACTPREKILLFVLVFFCCWVDWYGWVAAGITMAACLCNELVGSRPSWRQLISSYGVPSAGAAFVGGVFLFQLLSFPDGFHQLIYKYGIRSAHSVETVGMAGKLWKLWHEYLPTGHAVLFLLLSFGLYFLLLRKNTRRSAAVALAVSLFGPPFLWTLLLPQHSAVHEFSLLKFAVPTATLYVICVAWCAAFFRQHFAARDRLLEPALLLVIVVFAVTMTATHEYKPIVYQDDVWASQIAVLMKAAVGPNDLPLSDADMLEGSRPPHKLWFADRWIYPSYALSPRIRQHLVSVDALKTMHPVFLRPDGSAIPANVEHICAGLWENSSISILGKDVLLCRTDALRALYD